MNIYENIKKNLKESNALPVDYIIDNYDIYTNNGDKIDFPHYSAISETKNKILFKDRFYSSNWEKYLILDKNTNKITYKNKPYSFGYAVPKENSHKEENINESEDGHHMIPYDIQEEVENVVYDDRNLNLRSAQFKGNNFIVNYIDESSDELFDKILKRLDYYFNSYGILCDGIDDDGENVIAHNCYMSDEAYKEYEINNDSYDAEDEDFYMVNNDTDKKVHVYKDGNKWYDTDGNRYMGYLSKSDVKRYFKGNWSELNESENKKYTDDQIDKFVEDNYELVYEKLEKEVPDKVGAYYAREGTHHCSFIDDNIDYVANFVQEYLSKELDDYFANLNESDDVFKGYDQALPTVNDEREYLGYNLSDVVDAVEKFYGCNDRREAFNKIKNKEVSEEEIKKAMEYFNKPIYESENLKESSNIIWSSEVTEDDYDQEELKERYQEYVDNFDGTVKPDDYDDWLESDWLYNYLEYDFNNQEEYNEWYDFITNYNEDSLKILYNDYLEEMKEREPNKPKEFDDWKYDYMADDSYDQWNMKLDDIANNIYPMIDKQINNDILIVSGNYNSNYPDFRKSGAGGKFLNKAEDLLDWLEKEDRIDILNNNGVVGIAAYDHDGSIGGNLYTVPADDDLLYEIAMKTDYYDEDRSKEDVLGEFSYDVNNGNIDMSDFWGYEDKLIPIKVEW